MYRLIEAMKKMDNLKILTSSKGNYIYMVMGLIISISITLFLTPMFIAMIIVPLKDDPIDVSHILGMLFAGSIMMLIPIHFLSIIIRMRQIHYNYYCFQFSGKIIPWDDVVRITVFKGNSGRFTIKYKEGQKIKKVFGALFPFNGSEIIESLEGIADKKKVPLSNWWF